MANTKIVRIPHLGGIDAAYQMPRLYDPSKLMFVLVNSLATSSELYKAQFSNPKLNEAMNLLTIEPLGHGQTRTECENFMYWDTAIMNLQVMDAMGIQKAFVLGTSQGEWIVARMALLAPEKASFCGFATPDTIVTVRY
jgi:pimeloyl-ACP methyl ester carboxylesterase